MGDEMPTIEIVSINSTELDIDQADFDVAVIEDKKLKSHRGLFYDFLIRQNGVILHIGNPNFKSDKEGCFFAGAIVDWSVGSNEYITIPIYDTDDSIYDSGGDQEFIFKFLEQYKHDIDNLLKIALDKSPINKIYFLTDYQFGPEKEEIEIIDTVSDFWLRHDNQGLRLNTLYEIYSQ